MRTIWQDVRYGFRMLLKSRSFTLVALVALALGIGANTAIFSVVNAVLLRPLPYRDPARLVTVLHDGWKPVAPANFLDWREQTRVFDSMAAAQVWGPSLTGRDEPEQLKALQLSANMFDVLGVGASLGRTFAEGEDQPGRDHVVVLSDGIWRRRFGGDRKIVGQQIMLDGEAYTVAGVMPPDFQFAPFWATKAELWSPLSLAAPGARLVALIKPQFEVGPGRVGKGGIVRDAALHDEVCRRIESWLGGLAGWRVLGLAPSPIEGGDGNREFLIAAEYRP